MSTTPIPATADELTTSWLRDRLGGDVGSGPLTVTRIGADYGLAGTILRVVTGDRSMVVKLWRADSGAGFREVHVRQRLGDQWGPRVPKCRYAAADETTGNAVLVLEDLHDAVQGDCLTDLGPEDASALGHGFAALHAHWWDRVDTAATTWLPASPYLALTDDWIASRSRDFLDRFSDRLSKDFQAFITRAPARYRRARRRLTHLAPTLTHGDVHLDNVLFDARTGEAILLDWSHTAIAPGVLDVAELILAGPGTADVVIDAYGSGLADHGVPRRDTRDLDAALAAAVVVALIRNSLGIARWRPTATRQAAMIDTALRRCESAWRTWRRSP